ncbi:molecular chaperone DnaJ [Campylobacter sp. JMF_06 NA1]|uniref:molecular chaperone DnaJ n=1 Tax=Campylobacter sp. JMF_06 NA1 TaxID=2983823 RepID=UPI0022E9CF42|nr:molecular chaperone DnaJ [Campylobacter sp. JMF_06 NA1]MDA3078335.1 molecular chaperone DnaJ [Campylobacter sp. JMF_06 NA1]
MEEDYYDILGVARDADAETIKKAFRKLALQHHPDRNQGNKESEEQFKKINEAYQVLGDEEKRKMYDRYGKEGLSGGFGGGGNAGDAFGFGSMFSDFFEQAFGGGGSRAKRSVDPYGIDTELAVTLEFKEALRGVHKDVKYKIKKPCPTCDATGSKDKKKHTCQTCGGSGRIMARRGYMSFIQTCSACGGSGESIKEKCKDCGGKAYIEEEISVKFDIPAGIDDGQRIRLGGKGNVSKTGEVGDVYVLVRVRADSHFERDGDDLYIEVPVFFTQAILGESIEVPTPEGKTELKLKVGSKDKDRFVIHGEGAPNIRTKQKGDLIVQISVQTPKKLNDKQTELLRELQASFGENDEGILSKIKNFFK